MRKAQIKDSLMKNSGVERVCQELLETDRDFSHGVGKQYLDKLYKMENGHAKLEGSGRQKSNKKTKGYFGTKGLSVGGYMPSSMLGSIVRTSRTINQNGDK